MPRFNFQADAAAEVKLAAEVAQIEIATERAQALGLIVNEFLTNSFKYAFRGRSGTLAVVLSHEEGGAILVLGDDGPGMPQATEVGARHEADRSFVPADRRRGDLAEQSRHPPDPAFPDQDRLTPPRPASRGRASEVARLVSVLSRSLVAACRPSTSGALRQSQTNSERGSLASHGGAFRNSAFGESLSWAKDR